MVYIQPNLEREVICRLVCALYEDVFSLRADLFQGLVGYPTCCERGKGVGEVVRRGVVSEEGNRSMTYVPGWLLGRHLDQW